MSATRNFRRGTTAAQMTHLVNLELIEAVLQNLVVVDHLILQETRARDSEKD